MSLSDDLSFYSILFVACKRTGMVINTLNDVCKRTATVLITFWRCGGFLLNLQMKEILYL